jgi:hypothetical protein
LGSGGPFTVAHDAGREGLAVDVAVRPEQIMVERDRSGPATAGTIAGTIAGTVG